MATNDEKLDRILQAVSGLEQAVARMEEKQNAQGEKLHEHGDALFGNGKVGLKDSVILMAQDVSGIKTTCAAKSACVTSFLSRVLEKVVSSTASAIVIAIIVALFALWAEHAVPNIAGATQGRVGTTTTTP